MTNAKDGQPLLSVEGLKTYFRVPGGESRAVDDVSFAIGRGERVGLVGESGCGKSVTSLSIMRLLKSPPARQAGGRVMFDGRDLLTLPEREMRALRGRRIAMIFQEPMTALNPLLPIGRQIGEVFQRHLKTGRAETRERAIEALRRVHMPAAERRISEFPHQLSGGMRQRAMIAMALACNPDLLIADEPTTALDVTVQAQVVELMLELQQSVGTAILLITHDLGLVAEFCERVIVMYAGRVAEQADVRTLFRAPKHPYTRGLMGSVPKLGERTAHGRRHLQEIRGFVPNLAKLGPGCRFADRCPDALALCRQVEPPLIPQPDGSAVRCHLHAAREGAAA